MSKLSVFIDVLSGIPFSFLHIKNNAFKPKSQISLFIFQNLLIITSVADIRMLLPAIMLLQENLVCHHFAGVTKLYQYSCHRSGKR